MRIALIVLALWLGACAQAPKESVELSSTPGRDIHKPCDTLIAILKDASIKNLDQAALKASVEKPGAVGVRIAKKLPGLVGMFA